MTLSISRLLTTFSLQFESPTLEKSYQQIQMSIQNKLFLLLRLLLTGFLISLTLYTRINSLPLYDHLSQNIHLIVVLTLISIPTPWPIFQNIVFVFLVWFIQLLVPVDILLTFDQDDKALMFILGYAAGVIEVATIFSIKNSQYRLSAQIILALTKIFNFSHQDLSIIIISIGVTLVSLILLIYHDILERNSYKDMHDSRDKLTKLQTVLTDDLPISIVIVSANLKRIFYNNQYFVQSFLRNSHSLEPIETLFNKIILEFDDTNQQTSLNLPKVSFYSFVTETMNTHSRFNNRDVFNLYSLSQFDGAAQYHYEIKVRKISWEDNPAYTIVFNNVSEKQKATSLQEANLQRDRVIATITHELKTPINGILGLLDIIDSNTKDSISKIYTEHCKNCTKLLLYLVNSIIDLNQLRQNNLQVEKTIFSLDELLKEMQSLYAFTSEHRGLAFLIEKSPEVPNYICTDKYRLISILVQLLGNAGKFTFKGFVKLRVEMNRRNHQKLTFIVEDSGIGIREEDKIKLSNMFGQITEKKKNINHHGAGLGITIANELAVILNDPRHKKECIKYQSELGRGSVFKFKIGFIPDDDIKSRYLTEVDSFAENTRAEREFGSDFLGSPMKAVERNVLKNRQDLSVTSKGGLHFRDSSPAAETKKKVLIVDDHPFNLVAASFVMSKLDLQSVTAANGREAIDMLRESVDSGQHYSFILMDIQMPIMDGIQATKIINQMIQKGELYQIPIIVLTAKKIDTQEKELYKNCGVFDVLGKPLIEQELKNILVRLSHVEFGYLQNYGSRIDDYFSKQ